MAPSFKDWFGKTIHELLSSYILCGIHNIQYCDTSSFILSTTKSITTHTKKCEKVVKKSGHTTAGILMKKTHCRTHSARIYNAP